MKITTYGVFMMFWEEEVKIFNVCYAQYCCGKLSCFPQVFINVLWQNIDQYPQWMSGVTCYSDIKLQIKYWSTFHNKITGHTSQNKAKVVTVQKQPVSKEEQGMWPTAKYGLKRSLNFRLRSVSVSVSDTCMSNAPRSRDDWNRT
jgi:hypothetical protein